MTLTKEKKVTPAGIKEAENKLTSLKQKRICLKCGEKFPSKGPYNCICDRCNSVNERTVRTQYKVHTKDKIESVEYLHLVE
ncbi:MAG: hypothetical protein ISR98_00250 [Parcubacteria group bacterium]|nr:hypothetical protein [Parcubacteria group bacterium]